MTEKGEKEKRTSVEKGEKEKITSTPVDSGKKRKMKITFSTNSERSDTSTPSGRNQRWRREVFLDDEDHEEDDVFTEPVAPKANDLRDVIVEKKRNGNVKYWISLIALNFMIWRNVAVQSVFVVKSKVELMLIKVQ